MHDTPRSGRASHRTVERSRRPALPSGRLERLVWRQRSRRVIVSVLERIRVEVGVGEYLPNEAGRDVPARMVDGRGAAPVRVLVEDVAPALADWLEPMVPEYLVQFAKRHRPDSGRH